MFKIEQFIIEKIEQNFILLHVIEIFKNKLPLLLSITLRIKTNFTLEIKKK